MMMQAFESYLLKIKNTDINDQTEHTSRSALETLLLEFAAKGQGIKVQHEPRRTEGKGAPDYRITSKGMILGYVEVKAIGENLDKVLKSDQIAKYKTLSTNIILTDYLRFIWLGEKGVQARVELATQPDLESKKFQIKPENAENLSKLLDGFFSTPPQGIGTSEKLALALASRSRLLRDYLGEELVRQEREHQEGRLFGLFQVFKSQIFHDLTLKDFADAFAQMLAYGLFLARLNSGTHIISLANAKQFIPGSFQLIRELVNFLDELNKDEYREIKWVVEEVLSIVNGLDLAAIHENLSFRQRKAVSRKVKAKDEEEHRLFERDPFIYFYEDYLKAYDKDMRKGRGVYYTPPPIVNFIVRAVDDILKDKFEITDGLADHKRVTVLDFACGTGTFLLEVMNKIFENIGGAEKAKASAVVREHILKNIYGFEYLIAPYTIAHLKLSQYLKDKGHPLTDNERLQVYLANTLEPINPQKNPFVPEIAKEVKAAQAIKEDSILVIVGNPPYSGHSKNNSTFVKATIAPYKIVDGKPLGERNPKWLQDDYVKFIRFAQMKMDGGDYRFVDENGIENTLTYKGADEGVVGIITNHSWLDNPTFRGMRQSLMNSFEQIYVLDLHGNSKKKERALDGGKDENVFDIEQGVAISLFIKRKGLERGVWRGDLWGKRLEKYQAAMNENLGTAITQQLKPVSPDYLLIAQDQNTKAEFVAGVSIADAFIIHNVGAVTGRDAEALSFSRKNALEWLAVGATKGFDARAHQAAFEALAKDLKTVGDKAEDHLVPIAYRPFDIRWTYYTGKSDGFFGRPRPETMRLLLDENVGLVSARSNKSDRMDHVYVVDTIAEAKLGESTTQSSVFPLRSDKGNENLSPAFRAFLDSLYDYHYTPEEILGFIYAVLHSPTYRKRYAEFLRLDFPRIPFPETKTDFDALSKLGWELVQAHLLKKLPRRNLADLHGKGDNVVEAIRYSLQEQAIHFNKAQHFAPVPEDVWNFHVGGYQVLDKYLKSRKGRTLSLDEINHISAVADSLSFTVAQMAKIDVAYAAAFPQV